MLQWNEWVLLSTCMKQHCKKETQAYLKFIHSIHQRYKDKPITVKTIKSIHRQENTQTDQEQCVLTKCQTLLHTLLKKLKETLPKVIEELKAHKDTRLMKNLLDIQAKLNAMKEKKLTVQDVKKLMNVRWEIMK